MNLAHRTVLNTGANTSACTSAELRHLTRQIGRRLSAAFRVWVHSTAGKRENSRHNHDLGNLATTGIAASVNHPMVQAIGGTVGTAAGIAAILTPEGNGNATVAKMVTRLSFGGVSNR